jgi:Ca2+-transporting ATPase
MKSKTTDRPDETRPMGEDTWHARDIDQVFKALATSRQGLSEQEAERRLDQHGPNEIASGKEISKLEIFWSQIKNPLVAVLLAAAVISLLADKTVDAIVVAVVVILNTLIGFFQEYRAEEALEKLKSRAAPEAEVVRDCREEGRCVEMRVAATQVVPGDVLLLDAGDKVPADARLFQAHNLEVDESMLTGESTAVYKVTEPLSQDRPVAERHNVVYGGTAVVKGRGKAVIFATGAQTEMGKIATLIRETEDVASPLQKQTLDLGQKLGLLALGVAALTLLLGVVRGLAFEETFLFALASAVSSIPEGLPAVMTITLAVGVNRMARRNAIIRRLQAVDTLGAATVICTDKTGTLTTNQMTVQEIALVEKTVRVTGIGFEPHGRFKVDGEPIDPAADDLLRLALRIGALSNDARLVQHYYDDDQVWEIRGDPTEGALVVAATKAGWPKEALEERFQRIDEIPFSSQSKYMATFHRAEGELWVLVKGAPEVVLDMCSERRGRDDTQALEDPDVQRLLETNENMAGRALRVLGLAYQIIAPEALESFKKELEYGRADLIFVGLAGMIDPPRPEAQRAVKRCQRAGVRVVMVTGDHRLTGEAIAREVGILDDGGQVRVGGDVEQMREEALDRAVAETAVFARVAPAHKHRIVEALRRRGHIVAMTGDGVNDAPALQAAEIGVAMGITGTDVTKETAEMVLTDDNFASIVNAIEEGRGVFQNVRKVVKFLLTTNIGEDLTLLSALAFLPGTGLIITPVQILWVNLVTDGLLDITIGLEPKEDDLMDDPPRRPDTHIIDGEMLQNMVYVALFMAVGTLGLFLYAGNNGEPIRAQTVAFTTLAMFQIFNAFNCRSREKSVFQLGFFDNKYLIGAVVLSVLLKIAGNRIPFMQTALGTVPLAFSDWALIVLVSSSVFVADEIRKYFARRLRKSNSE